MSELTLAFLIAVAILAVMFVFVPMLHICNNRCQQFFLRRRSTLNPNPVDSQSDLSKVA